VTLAKKPVEEKNIEKAVSKLIITAASAISDSQDHSLDLIESTLAAYVVDMKRKFNTSYKRQAEAVQKKYGENISELGQEVLDAVSSGNYIDSIRVVKYNDSVSVTVDPAFALVAMILEYGNSELPPARHWADLERKFIMEGTNRIAKQINKLIADAIVKQTTRDMK
jgi:hypothetical protein